MSEKIKPLPESSNEYWGNAEKHITKPKKIKHKKITDYKTGDFRVITDGTFKVYKRH